MTEQDLVAALQYETSRADSAESLVKVLRSLLSNMRTKVEAIKTREGLQLILNELGLTMADLIQIHTLQDPTPDQRDN